MEEKAFRWKKRTVAQAKKDWVKFKKSNIEINICFEIIPTI